MSLQTKSTVNPLCHCTYYGLVVEFFHVPELVDTTCSISKFHKNFINDSKQRRLIERLLIREFGCGCYFYLCHIIKSTKTSTCAMTTCKLIERFYTLHKVFSKTSTKTNGITINTIAAPKFKIPKISKIPKTPKLCNMTDLIELIYESNGYYGLKYYLIEKKHILQMKTYSKKLSLSSCEPWFFTTFIEPLLFPKNGHSFIKNRMKQFLKCQQFRTIVMQQDLTNTEYENMALLYSKKFRIFYNLMSSPPKFLIPISFCCENHSYYTCLQSTSGDIGNNMNMYSDFQMKIDVFFQICKDCIQVMSLNAIFDFYLATLKYIIQTKFTVVPGFQGFYCYSILIDESIVHFLHQLFDLIKNEINTRDNVDALLVNKRLKTIKEKINTLCNKCNLLAQVEHFCASIADNGGMSADQVVNHDCTNVLKDFVVNFSMLTESIDDIFC